MDMRQKILTSDWGGGFEIPGYSVPEIQKPPILNV